MALLDTDGYRGLHSSALEDEALQLLLDAAEADILDAVGPDGSNVEWFGGGSRVLALKRRVSSITSIVEESPFSGVQTTLAADDYLVDPTGYLIYRQGRGTHPRWHWFGRVIVTYTSASTDDQRKVAQADLVFLAENYAPGVTSETVGSWTQLYQQATAANQKERDAILARLIPHGRMAIVGSAF